MTRHELLTAQELDDLRQIDVLLDEANAHSLARDGHCKSSEGNVSVDLGNHWDRDPEEPRKPVKVTVYSYLLGPHRQHYFDNTKQALDVVKQWHRQEMSWNDDTGRGDEPDLYLEIEQKRDEEMAEMFRALDEEFGGSDA
jgi:hypothetical protein